MDVGVLAVLLMIISSIDVLLMENTAIIQVLGLLLAFLVLGCCCLTFDLSGLLIIIIFFLEQRNGKRGRRRGQKGLCRAEIQDKSCEGDKVLVLLFLGGFFPCCLLFGATPNRRTDKRGSMIVQ